MECSVLNGTLHHPLPQAQTQRPGIISGCEMSSGHAMTMELKTSQQSGLTTQDLHKSKESQNSGVVGLDYLQAPPFTEDMLIVDIWLGRESPSSLSMWIRRFPVLQWMISYPYLCGQTLDLVGYYKDSNLGGRCMGEVGEENWG